MPKSRLWHGDVVGSGRIVQQGIHDELVRQNGLYRRFVVEHLHATG